MHTDRRAIIAFAAIAGTSALAPWSTAAEAADGSVYVIAELVAMPGQEATLRDALAKFARGVPKEPGCLSYHLHEDVAVPGRFLTYEVWRDKAAIAAHFQTPAMKAAGPAMAQILAKPLALNALKLIV